MTTFNVALANINHKEIIVDTNKNPWDTYDYIRENMYIDWGVGTARLGDNIIGRQGTVGLILKKLRVALMYSDSNHLSIFLSLAINTKRLDNDEKENLALISKKGTKIKLYEAIVKYKMLANKDMILDLGDIHTDFKGICMWLSDSDIAYVVDDLSYFNLIMPR